jgi:hypothetical protein
VKKEERERGDVESREGFLYIFFKDQREFLMVFLKMNVIFGF